MNDRVLFLTNGTSTIPAEEASRANGFPWPPSTPGLAPITLTFQEQMEWWWRIKKWSFDCSAVLHTFNSDGTHPKANPLSWSSDFVRAESRELDLYIGNQVNIPATSTPGLTAQYWSDPDGGFIDVSVSTDLGLLMFLHDQEFSGDDPTGDYFPYFQVGGGFGGRLPNPFRTAPSSAIAGTLDILGRTLDVWIDFPRFSPDEFLSDIAITITPSEWWPFAAKDGSPIYDTTDGSQLQDPRN